MESSTDFQPTSLRCFVASLPTSSLSALAGGPRGGSVATLTGVRIPDTKTRMMHICKRKSCGNSTCVALGLALTVLGACAFPYEHRWLKSVKVDCDYHVIVRDGHHLKGSICYASELANSIRQRATPPGGIHEIEALLESEDFLCDGDQKELKNLPKKEIQRITCAILHQDTHPSLVGRIPTTAYRWTVEVEERRGEAANVRAYVETLHKE